jgi:hypothetical protein
MYRSNSQKTVSSEARKSDKKRSVLEKKDSISSRTMDHIMLYVIKKSTREK